MPPRTEVELPHPVTDGGRADTELVGHRLERQPTSDQRLQLIPLHVWIVPPGADGTRTYVPPTHGPLAAVSQCAMRSASSALRRCRSTGASPPCFRTASILPSITAFSSCRKLSSIASRPPGSRSARVYTYVTSETNSSSSRGSPASGSAR